MATDNSNGHQVGDINPDTQITTTGQTSRLPMIKDLDANNIDSNNDKADIKTDLDSAQVNAPETQGSSLPKLTQVIITNIPRLKYSSKDPEAWALRVKFALAQLRLQHLINSSVPRPAKGQHNFNRWAKWSRTVASWLYLQADEGIQEKLQRLRKIPSKADDLFDKIMDVVRESDKTVNATVKARNYNSRRDPTLRLRGSTLRHIKLRSTCSVRTFSPSLLRGSKLYLSARSLRLQPVNIFKRANFRNLYF